MQALKVPGRCPQHGDRAGPLLKSAPQGPIQFRQIAVAQGIGQIVQSQGGAGADADPGIGKLDPPPGLAPGLGFALGRGLTIQDSCSLDDIVAQVKDNDYKAQTLIEAIVLSTPFRYKAPASPKKEDRSP